MYQEVELHEASTYGLLERIPVLLTSVSVDAADAVSMTGFSILKWLSGSYSTSKGQSLPVCVADKYQPDHKWLQILICDHLPLV